MSIEISKEDSEYMYNLVKRIVDEVGPRMPCSPQEAEGANIIKEELAKCCDEVSLESFKCHPKAFLGWIKMIVIIVPISMISYLLMQLASEMIWLTVFSIISFVLVLLSLVIMWEEFFNYREFIDRLFRKKPSQNVVGKFKAQQKEGEKIIIFSSHIDSALQFNLLKVLKWGFLPLAFGAILIILIWLILSTINLTLMIIGFIDLKSTFFLPTIWLLIIGSPCYVSLFFFVPSGEKGNIVPGAVDNLSSCSVIVGLGRYLKQHRDIIPENTEIRLISFGCEESGLRGAFRYASAHLDELKKKNTVVFNMDGLETPDQFLVIEYEPTTRTKHSEEVVNKILRAAEMSNVNAKKFGAGKLEKTVGRLSGGSDAAAFSKAGIKAGFLNSADWKTRSSYYHQSTDTPDKIRKGTLENALRICLTFIFNEIDNR
ncbi:MAG: M28 family peptidase [Candidatus Lokiarchaeota archaeon]|nr:M28 family peptidase [Candidatus Lokiarchaeota archaeon]